MNFDRLTDTLTRLERILAACERGSAAATRLLGPLHEFTSEMCARGGQLAGRSMQDWCELGHALRDGIAFALATGQRITQAVARVRKVMTPLFQLVREAQEVLSC